MKIVQISDLHVVAKGKTLGRAPMAENLVEVVADINARGPDLVLVSGDISDTGRLADVERAAAILAGLKAPYFVTPGNHDSRESLQKALPPAALPATQTAHLSYALGFPALRILALDTTDPDHPNGRICQQRLQWLEAELAASHKPVFIFMHHPPVKFSVAETDMPPLEGAAEMGAVIAQHGHIQRILCGHIHLFAQAFWNKCLVCSAPSIGMRLHWAPSTPTDSRYMLSPPAYLWHMPNADGDWITHGFTLDKPDGPFAFS